MPSRRAQIEMSDPEVEAFLEAEKVAVVSSIGPRGWPHSMPLWYVLREGRIFAWTFAKSQKIKNLERDQRASVLVEAGDEYAELRGVHFESNVHLHDDVDFAVAFAEELTARYASGGEEPSEQALAAFRAQAPKRMVMEFEPVRTVSWDHRKLAGLY